MCQLSELEVQLQLINDLELRKTKNSKYEWNTPVWSGRFTKLTSEVHQRTQYFNIIPQDDELSILYGLLVLRKDSIVGLWAWAQRRRGLALVAGWAQLQRWGGTQRLWATLQNHAHRPQLGLAAGESRSEENHKSLCVWMR